MLDWEVDGKKLTPEQAADMIVQGDVACAADLSKTADLADFNTEASAADVNDLRQALSYDKVNLWGVSYGTNLALEVMRSYPQGLRSVVLDSVLPPDVDSYVEAPANAARAFNELFDTCAADAVCNSAYPDLRQVMTDTVAQLNEKPASFEVSNALTGETYPMVLTGNDLMGMVFQLLYMQEVIPYLPQMIYDARDGKFDLLRRMEGVLIAQQKAIREGVFYSGSCRDEVTFSSQAEYEKAIARYPALKGMFEVTNLSPVGYRTCARWGAGQAPASANEPVTSTIPTLLMAGQYDPITPPSWTQHAGQTLKNSHFYEYPGVGHGASLAKGCPQDMMLAFIEDPSAAPDDSCIADMPAVKWVVAGQAEPVTMEPFTNSQMGTQGVAPAGWEQVNPGVYSRGSSALDSAVLLEQAAPMSGQELLNLLVTQLGLKETPKPVGEREANGLTWQLYNVEVQGLAIDIAIAESGSSALVVLLQSDPNEHDALYESVFIPAVDALQLSK
jgi:pimeloyl-ACP methyl ester carboxylesterase